MFGTFCWVEIPKGLASWDLELHNRAAVESHLTGLQQACNIGKSHTIFFIYKDTCKYHKITKIANITKISKTRLVRPQLLRSLRLVRSLILLRLISDLHILDHLSNHGDLGDLSNLKNLRDLVLLKKVQLYKSKISNNSKTWPHWEILTTVLKSAPQNCLEKFLNPNPHKIHLKFLCCVIN